MALYRAGHTPDGEREQALRASTLLLCTHAARCADALSMLSAYKQALAQQISLNRAMLAPIRRLPMEVLSLVFDALIQGDDPFHAPATLSRTVMKVCRMWLTTATSMGGVWRFLDIREVDTLCERDWSLVRRHADLALSRPLRMRWSHCYCPWRLRLILEAYRERWEYLELTDSWDGCSPVTVPPIMLPRLECVRLRLHGRSRPRVLQFIDIAPCLRDVAVEALLSYGDNSDSNEEVLPFFPCFASPAPRLTHLTLFLSLPPLLSTIRSLLLDCAESLVVFSMSSGVDWDCPDPLLAPICMRHLQKMDLGWEACELTWTMEVPSLTSLTLRNIIVEDDSAALEDLVANPFDIVLWLFRTPEQGPRLTYIKLERVDPGLPRTIGKFVRMAEMLTELKHLVLDDSHNRPRSQITYNDLLRHLECCKQSVKLLPRLQTLEVLLGSQGADIDTFVDLDALLECRRQDHLCDTLSIAWLDTLVSDIPLDFLLASYMHGTVIRHVGATYPQNSFPQRTLLQV
ncbi:uncharacterized protein SCHCODRAFT_02663841 [Schizophyllum commune H4-8]|nr:uncharacterized protein SCHCODRAFT_02663841 [Schizophyllum commune H4-8]KAI5895964.1 hypothetical protein SCHCODRAFT_02663841 [Schizophyllum commune H4-8]